MAHPNPITAAHPAASAGRTPDPSAASPSLIRIVCRFSQRGTLDSEDFLSHSKSQSLCLFLECQGSKGKASDTGSLESRKTEPKKKMVGVLKRH